MLHPSRARERPGCRSFRSSRSRTGSSFRISAGTAARRTPRARFSHRQAALDVFALLDQMGVKSFKAIGASSGAMTLVHMATQQPARIEAMVLVGGTDQIGPEVRALLRDPDCEKLTPEEWKAKREIHKHGDEQILALQRIFCAAKDRYDDMNFTPPYLSTISARTLIVHGDHDRFFPVRIPVEMYGAIPRSYLWIVPNGGHIPAFSAQAPGRLPTHRTRVPERRLGEEAVRQAAVLLAARRRLAARGRARRHAALGRRRGGRRAVRRGGPGGSRSACAASTWRSPRRSRWASGGRRSSCRWPTSRSTNPWSAAISTSDCRAWRTLRPAAPRSR